MTTYEYLDLLASYGGLALIYHGIRVMAKNAEARGRFGAQAPRSDDRVRAQARRSDGGHPPPGRRGEPLLRGRFIQASCGPCHAGALKDAPLIQKGKLMNGCLACHKIRGAGEVVGPDLKFASERKKYPEWHIEHFKFPQKVSPGSAMPAYGHLKPADLEALTVYMLSLRRAPSALALAAPRPAAGKK